MFFDTENFPQEGADANKLKKRLGDMREVLEQRDVHRNLGLLYTPPTSVALQAYQYFLDQNPNHLGNWSTNDSRPFATEILEREVIAKLIHLYGGTSSDFEGYVTSGGTEGNLYSAWIGRQHLEQYMPADNICLIGTNLSHYSIGKSANIIGVRYIVTSLSRSAWNMDTQGLVATVQKLYAEGYRGFMIVLTIGYTTTGTVDNVQEILHVMRSLKISLTNSRFFVWIDAALNGLITPFLDTKFSPLALPDIQSIVVDFHKFGGVPYPAGIILYRSSLRLLTERPIDYLLQSDNTLLGSRSGIPAVAIWAVIHSQGKGGFKTIAKEQLQNKEVFMKAIRRIYSDAEIITGKNSLTCAIHFRSLKESQFPQWFEEKYWLFPKETIYQFQDAQSSQLCLYKFYFLPHLKRAIVDEFIHDLESLQDSNTISS